MVGVYCKRHPKWKMIREPKKCSICQALWEILSWPAGGKRELQTNNRRMDSSKTKG